MSFILGAYSISNNSLQKQIKSVFPDCSFDLVNKNYYVIAGGLSSTLYYGKLPSGDDFCVSGIGILENNTEFCCLTASEWAKYMQLEDFPSINLNGHFAALSAGSSSIKLHTDVLGLRNWFVLLKGDIVYFSTYSGALIKLAGPGRLNFSALASRWLLQNQFSDGAPIMDTLRLCKGAKLEIKNSKEIEITYPDLQELSYMSDLESSENAGFFKCVKNSKFYLSVNRCETQFSKYRNKIINTLSGNLPDIKTNNDSVETITRSLQNFLTIPEQTGYKTAIGLSGGMDSRVLLSLMLSAKNVNFQLVTFGEQNHLDSLIAKKICYELKLSHRLINPHFAGSNSEIDDILVLVPKLQLIGPASEYLNRRNHSILENEGLALLDGSWGEIGRRSFYNRLLYKCKDAIHRRNAEIIFNELHYPHPDIFNRELTNELKIKAKRQIENVLSAMPYVSSIGIENWLDLLAWNYKFPNYNGVEQTRLDDVNFCLSPFAQVSFYQNAFLMPMKFKSNANYYKSIIKKIAPRLAKVQLVKGNVTIPYSYPTILARLSAKLKKRLGLNYPDHTPYLFLDTLKSFILEISSAKSFKECNYYDHRKIAEIINGYYKGRKELAPSLDQWLSFELFRIDVES